jgi:hypothetical protein
VNLLVIVLFGRIYQKENAVVLHFFVKNNTFSFILSKKKGDNPAKPDSTHSSAKIYDEP